MPSSSRSVFVLEFVLGLASILSPAVAQYPKLDPRQRELLSAAKSQLDRAGANIERLAQATTRLKVGDPSVRLQDVEVLLERKREAVQSLVDANSRFRQLPLAHPDVKAQAERLRPLRESLSEAEQQLIVVHDALVAAVGAGSEVSAVVDFERLREFASSFGELVPLSADVERATAVAKLLPRLRAERSAVAERHRERLQQSTPIAKEWATVLADFDRRFAEFTAAVDEFAAAAPADLARQLSGVLATAQAAVASGTHAEFGAESELSQRVERIARELALLEAIAPAGAPTDSARAAFASAIAKLRELSGGFVESIVAAATMPPDRYRGADREALIAVLRACWQADGNGKAALAVGIRGENWRREVRWDWIGDAWRRIDRSRLDGFVIAAHDERVAVRHAVELTKDHGRGDAITARLVEDPSAEPAVSVCLLRNNVR